jgi:hypothetical protein
MLGFGPLSSGPIGVGPAQASNAIVLLLDEATLPSTLIGGVVIQQHVLTLATSDISSNLPLMTLGVNIYLALSRQVRFESEQRGVVFDRELRSVEFSSEKRSVIFDGENRSVIFGGEDRLARF